MGQFACLISEVRGWTDGVRAMCNIQRCMRYRKEKVAMAFIKMNNYFCRLTGRSKRSRNIRGSVESVQYILDSLRLPSAGKYYEASEIVVDDGRRRGRLLGLNLHPC